MTHLLLASSGDISVTQALLTVIGSGGLITAFVAVIKLRPDANTAAVTQSAGAMEQMALLQRELREDRDMWRERALKAEHEYAMCLEGQSELTEEIDRLRKRLGEGMTT